MLYTLGGPAVRETVQAVLEALMWVQVMLEDLVNDPDGVRKALHEVEEVIDSLKHGIAVDFKQKVKYQV